MNPPSKEPGSNLKIMKHFSTINWLQIIYLGFLLTFIGIYFIEIRPIKIEAFCKKTSVEQVQIISFDPDPASSFENLYKSCLVQKSSGFII